MSTIRWECSSANTLPLPHSRSTHRAFGMPEWKELASKLADWKGHLDSLLAVMRKEGQAQQ